MRLHGIIERRCQNIYWEVKGSEEPFVTPSLGNILHKETTIGGQYMMTRQSQIYMIGNAIGFNNNKDYG
jgi:hypothetical protein